MKKDYKRWHLNKEKINDDKLRPFFHEREVWFCHLGANIGFEQDGKGGNFGRPVIIFRKFNNEVFWGLPLTTKAKHGKFYMAIDLCDTQIRNAIISQIRLLDAKRLYQKIAVVSKNTHELLKQKMIQLCKN